MVHHRCSAALCHVLIVALAASELLGCQPKKLVVNFNQELPPGQLALRRLSPGEYPDFSVNMTDPAALVRSADNSLKYMGAPSSKQYFPYLDITHERAVATLRAFRQLVQSHAQQAAADGGQAFNQEIRQKFEVYKSIGAPSPDGVGYTEKVLFTGYYTPTYNASLTRSGAFQYPLYRRPDDLATDPATGETLGRKTPAGVVPYYTRAEIEGQGKLAGQELVWLTSRWEAYAISIQGSARLRLTDGRIYEIGYAGVNGYDYASPGEQMVADGVISKDQHTGRGIRGYFQANPGAMDKYLWVNKRFIFFTERPGGPYGSLNVPVTTMASIAVDKKPDPRKNIYPRSMPTFLTVPMPVDEAGNTKAFRGFMMDQDTGGAIRAAGRCDIYMGIGEQAERLAGQQLHEGELYYIALRPELVPQFTTPVTQADVAPAPVAVGITVPAVP